MRYGTPRALRRAPRATPLNHGQLQQKREKFGRLRVATTNDEDVRLDGTLGRDRISNRCLESALVFVEVVKAVELCAPDPDLPRDRAIGLFEYGHEKHAAGTGGARLLGVEGEGRIDKGLSVRTRKGDQSKAK